MLTARDTLETEVAMTRPIAHPFNLIEITIALGVIAIGVVAILGLFPIAANSTRDAMAETYAAQVAEQLTSYTEQSFRKDWTTALAGLGTSKPDTAYGAGTAVPGTGDTIFDFSTAPAVPGKYRVIRYIDLSSPKNDVFDSGTDIQDFEAMVVVWRSIPTIFDRDGNGAFGGPDSLDTDGDWDADDETIAYGIAVQLNVEVSWPAQVDYAKRKSALFVVELFKR